MRNNRHVVTSFDDSLTIASKIKELNRRLTRLEKNADPYSDNDRNIVSFLNQYGVTEVTDRPWYTENFTYNSYQYILSRYDSLMTAFPNLITKTQHGTDGGGRPLVYYTINARANLPQSQWDADNRRRFTDKNMIIFTGVDGDDYVSIITVFYKIRDIVNQVTENDAFILNNFNLIIAPCVNPYGIDYNSETNANGIDISANLNTPAWTPGGDRGTIANSEPETQMIAYLMDTFGNTVGGGTTNKSFGNVVVWAANGNFQWWSNETNNPNADFRFWWTSANNEHIRHELIKFGEWHLNLVRKNFSGYLSAGSYNRNTVSTQSGNVAGYATTRGLQSISLFPPLQLMNTGSRVDSDSLDLNWIYITNFFNTFTDLFVGLSPRDKRFIYLSEIGLTNANTLTQVIHSMPSTTTLSVDLWSGDAGSALANSMPSANGTSWVGAGRLEITKSNAINSGLEIAYITFWQRQGTGNPALYYALNDANGFRGWFTFTSNSVGSVVPNAGGGSDDNDDVSIEDETDPTDPH